MRCTRSAASEASAGIPQQTAPVSTPDAAPLCDPAEALCQRWREIESEARELGLSWQRLETSLFKEHDWPNLTAAQQGQLPQAAPLFAIEERLRSLDEVRLDLLPQIRASTASTRCGALAKLDVLASLVDLADPSEALELVRSAQADITRLWA